MTSTPAGTSPLALGDVYVSDARREVRGIDAVRRWLDTEMADDNVTVEPVEVIDHRGDTIVRGRCGRTYDKSNLPGKLIGSNYSSDRDGKIVSVPLIRDRPPNTTKPTSNARSNLRS